MGIICSIFGHKLDEEQFITLHRDTNIKGKRAKAHVKFCERCRALIMSRWDI